MTKATRSNLTHGRVNAFTCPADKPQVFLWDIDVPGLAVRATKGSKSYIFQGWLNAAALRITIGATKIWTLGDARTEARRLKILLDQGVDPRAEAKAKTQAKEDAEQQADRRKRYTLQALCDAYVEYLYSKDKHKSAGDVKSAFKVHVTSLSQYATLPAQEVTSHQIATIIRKVRETGKERTAGILRNYITAAYNAARRAPFDSSLPSDLIAFEITTNPADAIPTIPVQRGTRTLSIEELKEYYSRLKDDKSGFVLKIALLSGGQRIRQLLRAKVSDYTPETSALKLWDIKGKRVYAREHVLPLGPVATALVKERLLKADDVLFAIKEESISQYIARISKAMGGVPFNHRDIRRTVETQLASMGVHKDIRAQLLSHGISGVQAAHYDRYEYFKEKQETLVAWEEYLTR